MKKFFRMVAAFSLACGMFAVTGCNDYEQDINSLNNRIDELTTGQIASLDEQIKSLGSAIDEADGLISTLQGSVDALETAKSTLEDQIKAINGNIDDINGNITGLNSQISDLKTDLEKLVNDANEANKAEIEKINGEIDALKTEVETQKNALGDLTSLASELSGKVAALEGLTAGLPELEQTVSDIKDNYLSKTEAASLYATAESVTALVGQIGEIEGRLAAIEDLNIADRLDAVEKNYENLNDIVVPGLEDAIAAAQTAADNAQVSADNAQSYAESVFGDLEALKAALGTYAEAGALEAKMDELDAMDKALEEKDAALQQLIDALDEEVAGKFTELQGNIDAVQSNLDKAVQYIDETMLKKADFEQFFSKSLMDDIAKEDGQVNSAINEKVSAAQQTLKSSIDAINKKIDEEITPAITDLKTRMENAEAAIENLENRIQSLVYVPEFSDGRAPVYTYTISGKSVSEKAVATATFKVTPAAIADYVVNQYKENLLVEVVPVKSVATRASQAPIIISGDDLKVVKGAAAGYVDVEVSLPVAEVEGDIAFSLYVASAEEINKAETEGVVDMDAGTYVSSEFVPASVSEKALDEAYVLYDGEKEISEEELLRDVAWPDEDRLVDFYAGFALNIKIDDKYYALEDAAELMRVDVAAITPVFSNTVSYLNAEGTEDESLADFFKVSVAEPYGPVVDMAKTGSEMAEKVGSQVVSDNVFTLTVGEDKFEVLKNQTVYTVVNKPVSVTVEAQEILWSYAQALELADDSENPTKADVKPIFLKDLPYTADFAGYDFGALLDRQPISTTVTVNGTEVSGADAPSLILIDATDKTVNAYITNYAFSQETANEYVFTYEYKIDKTANCTVSFKVVLGQMPSDATIAYGEIESKFFTTGAQYYDIADAYAEAYKFAQDQAQWFTDADEFKASMELNSAVVEKAEKSNGEGAATPVSEWTRLRITPEAPAEGSHVRISSSDITAVGDQFAFTTTVKTWYGVTYTYTASTVIPAPDYKLAYDSANVSDGAVTLKYEIVNGVYNLQVVNLKNYLRVIGEGLAGLPEDELRVSFEVLTAADPEAGIVNLPDLSSVLNVNEQSGMLDDYTIDWSSFTGRELSIRANLMAGSDNIVVNSIDLKITVPAIVTSFTATAEPVEVTRKAGNDATFKLWQYLEATSMFSNGENFIPYVNSDGVEHTEIKWVNENAGMKLYRAVIEFDDELVGKVTDNGGTLIGSYVYDPDKGTLTYEGDNAVIANPVTFTVGATLRYYLDYNGKVIEDPQGAYRVELKIRVSEQN